MPGTKAGWTDSSGYLHIALFSRPWKAHRLSWAIHYGVWPDGDVDHINRNKSDNRICNLRIATRQQNMFNMSPTKRSKLGLKGISWDRNRYRVSATFNGKNHYIGRFKTLDEAKAAYDAYIVQRRGEFAVTNLAAGTGQSS